MPPVEDVANRAELAEKLKGYIRRAEKTQTQLAEELNTDKTYISQMATGKVNWVNSSYFPALAEALSLSKEEIRELKPEIIWETPLTPDPPDPSTPTRYPSGSPIPPVVPLHQLPLVIPPELQRVIDEHGDEHPELHMEPVLRLMLSPRDLLGPENGPQTEKEWLRHFYYIRDVVMK